MSESPRRAAAPAAAAAASIAALGAFATVLGAVVTRRADAFDLEAELTLQRHWPQRLAGAIEAASWPGFPPQSRIIPSLVISASALRGRPRAAAFLGAAWGTGLLSTVIKTAVHRPRPLPAQVQVFLHTVSGSSFPSGHVLTYTGFYGFLAYLLHREVENGPAGDAAAIGLLGLIASVGLSRIHEGHHWPSDVLASYLLGLGYVLALIALYEATGTPAPAAARGTAPPLTRQADDAAFEPAVGLEGAA